MENCFSIILEKIYGWKIGHIDDSLKTKSRQFNIDRTSVYDFLMNDICEALSSYSGEWNTLIKLCMKPKCEISGYCTESKSCGRKPKKESIK